MRNRNAMSAEWDGEEEENSRLFGLNAKYPAEYIQTKCGGGINSIFVTRIFFFRAMIQNAHR